MRAAKVSDYWRKLYNRNYKVKISQLEFNNLKGLGDGSINFHGGITALCGLNGVGKTTVLNSFVGILNDKENKQNSLIDLKLKDSELILTVEGELDNPPVKLKYQNGTTNESEINENFNFIWIDVSANSPAILDYFSSVKNLEEFLDTVEPYLLNEKEIDVISYILGREYDSCSFYELEVDGETVPYFKVSIGEVSYGSEHMGLGELSALLIYWSVKRASNNSILIIDEPENYLSYNSQIALIDMLAKYCSEKSIWAIIATHAFGILKRIPAEHIKLFTRVQNDIRISTYNNQRLYFQALGMPTARRGIILTEDRAAREFSKNLISYFIPQIFNEFEFKDAGSVSEIKKCLKFPEIDGLKIIGLFDGDQEGLDENYNWPYTFLPGNLSLERTFKAATLNNIERAAEDLNMTTDNLHLQLSIIDGLDPHDWLEEFSKKTGSDYNHLIKVLFNLFLLEHKDIVDEFISDFRQLLS